MGQPVPILPFSDPRISRGGKLNKPIKGGLLHQLHKHHHEQTNSTPKLTPRKALLFIIFTLLALSLLHRPVSHCYNQLPRPGSGLRTPEERARHILAHTPLIGESYRIKRNLLSFLFSHVVLVEVDSSYRRACRFSAPGSLPTRKPYL